MLPAEYFYPRDIVVALDGDAKRALMKSLCKAGLLEAKWSRPLRCHSKYRITAKGVKELARMTAAAEVGPGTILKNELLLALKNPIRKTVVA